MLPLNRLHGVHQTLSGMFKLLVLLLQVALDKAAELMDIAAAGEEGSSYAAITQQLAEAYQKAGLKDVANFIKAAS